MVDTTAITKYAAHFIVASYAAKYSNKVVAETTTIDADGLPAKLGCAIIGEIVASKADPYTDVIVEKTVARYQSWKTRRNANK